MKKTIAILLCALLAACASTPAPTQHPNTSLKVEPETHVMSRQEIINAVHECEGAGLRALIVTTKRKINNQTTDAVVDVTCSPRFKL